MGFEVLGSVNKVFLYTTMKIPVVELCGGKASLQRSAVIIPKWV